MTARISNQIQRYFVEETRLGIPVALQTENLCGWPGAGGTLFPAQINLASTWQPEFAQAMSQVIGQESRAVGANSAMSPVLDVSRDPRWGRTYKTYGEDPYLVSRMGGGLCQGHAGGQNRRRGLHRQALSGLRGDPGGAELRGRPHWGPGVVRDLCHPL